MNQKLKIEDKQEIDKIDNYKIIEVFISKTEEECNCGLVCCECDTINKHNQKCNYRKSILNSMIECDHGLYFCETCDECTCENMNKIDKP